MNQEQIVLLIIKDTVSKAPPDERAKIEAAAEKLRAVVAESGAWGSVALALVGAEMAAQP